MEVPVTVTEDWEADTLSAMESTHITLASLSYTMNLPHIMLQHLMLVLECWWFFWELIGFLILTIEDPILGLPQ